MDPRQFTSLVYRPLEAWPFHADAIPKDQKETALWPFVFAGAGERLDMLRASGTTAKIAARGLAVEFEGKPSAVVEGDSRRPAFAQMRFAAPSFMSLASWNRVLLDEDNVLWVPSVRDFRALLNGESVELPELLKGTAVDAIRVAVPSQEMMSPESRQMHRGTLVERLETAFRLGDISGEGPKAVVAGAGLPKVSAERLQDTIVEWREKYLRPTEGVRAFATLKAGPDGRVSFGHELAARTGALNVAAWKGILPELAQREERWVAARQLLAPTDNSTQTLETVFVGGAVKAGSRYLGSRSQLGNADELAEDLGASIAWIRELTAPGRTGQADGRSPNGGPLRIDPTRSLEDWDPRGVAWFFRSVLATFPVKANLTPEAGKFWKVVRQFVAAADCGECRPMITLHEQLAKEFGLDSAAASRLLLQKSLNAVVLQAAVDTMHIAPLAGDRAKLTAVLTRVHERLAATISPEPTPVVVNYHVLSDIERTARNAMFQEAFEVRGTADTKSTVSAERAAVSVQFPSLSEALQGGITPTYRAPKLQRQLFGFKGQLEAVPLGSVVQSLTGGDWREWFDYAEGKRRDFRTERGENGLAVRDLATHRFIHSLAAVAVESRGRTMTEWTPEFASTLVRFVESQQALASVGFGENTPSASSVVSVLTGQVLPRELLNSVHKYADIQPPENSTGERTPTRDPAEKWRPLSGEQAFHDLTIKLSRLTKDLHGEGTFQPLRVETGNPFILDRAVYLHPSEPEARMEVNSWLRCHQDVCAGAPFSKEPLGRFAQTVIRNDDFKQRVAQLERLETALHNHDERLSELVQRFPVNGGGLVPLDSLFEAFSALEASDRSLDPSDQGAPKGAEAVYALGLAIANFPKDALPEHFESGSDKFAEFVKTVAEWKGVHDIESYYRERHQSELSAEAKQWLVHAVEARDLHDARRGTVAAIQQTMFHLEHVLDGVRREYPMLEFANAHIGGLGAERFAYARTLLAQEDAGGASNGGREALHGLVVRSKQLVERPQAFENECRAAATLLQWRDEAVKDLTSASPLVVPLVVVEKGLGQNQQTVVAGHGGAYFRFLSRCAAGLAEVCGKRPTAVPEFDRTGEVQSIAVERWGRSAAIEINAHGIAAIDDRGQLNKMGSVTRFPEGVAAVASQVETRVARDWQQNIDRRNDNEHPAQGVAPQRGGDRLNHQIDV